MREVIFRLVSWFVLIICLAVTVVAWQNAQNQFERAKQARFDSHVRQTTAAFIDRMAIYTDAHYGGVGLFVASEYVSRSEWRKYIETLNIVERYPGINGIGYAVPVSHSELKRFELETQKDGVPNYLVYPPGKRPDYFAIKYIEPIEINGAALGYDMGSEQTRRMALEKARDTGKPTISGKIILVQDAARTPGFLLYVPFYKEGSHPKTVEARRQNFRGWVYAPFIASDFIGGIFQQSLYEIKDEITLEIYNDQAFSKNQNIYESPRLSLTGNDDSNIEFQTITTVNLHGQEWTLRVKTTPTFYDEFTGHYQLILILVGGIVLSLVLFGFVYFMVRTRGYAIKLADDMTVELKEANKRLRRVDKLKDEFLANTSHELRTPLNGIIGIAESMIDGATGQLTPQQIRNLSMVSGSGRRLASLVNDILDFSKLKHREIELQIRPVNMQALADVVLNLSQLLVQNKDVRLANAVPVETPLVAGDENRLQQILYNLLGNAIKFTSEGTITVSATPISPHPRNERGKDYLEIAVSDTGIGIPANKLDHIFESFEQAEGSTEREFGGTGLGLTISKQLVELHGGEIRVESTLHLGSTFIFTLPIAEKLPEQLELPAIKEHSIITQPLGETILTEEIPASVTICSVAKTTVLIVDDEPVNLQVLHNHLSLQNYHITQSTSGQEVLEALENDLNPDLILLDVMMPRMSGYEVCRRLREKYSLSELPILMLTAKNQAEDILAGFDAGANDYLTKPIDKQELLARINTFLSLKQAMELLADYNRTLEQKVEERTQELSQTLERLKRTQHELVQSEKMAALGQLVASIAHEINTPLGAIRSSVGNISSFLAQTLEQLPEFFCPLSKEQKQDFFALLHRSLQQETLFTLKEERQFKRALSRQLGEHAIENAATIATKLVNMGIYDNTEAILPLLKTPNSAEIIQLAYKLSGLQKSTQNISIATERASKVVFALKSFARYDPSGKKVQANPIDGIETVLTIYHHQLKQGVEVIKNYADMPQVLCYPDELNQVWTNLIHNALHAMNYKGTLQIDATMQESNVLISITDSGIGISDDIKPKIFEPFFTTKPPGEGSGLGLDIVRKIIEKHGGNIAVDSEPGKTTFSVSIPGTSNTGEK
jgi:signal transduction histidine kinase